MRRASRLPFRRLGGGNVPVPILLGATYWWDPSMNVTLVSGRVSSFIDRISGVDATQAVTTRRPLWNASDANFGGRPSITYDATRNDTLAATVPNVAYGQHELFVTRYIAAIPPQQSYFTLSNGTSGSRIWARVRGLPSERFFVDDNLGGLATVDGSTTCVGAMWADCWDDGVNINVENQLGGLQSVVRPGDSYDVDAVNLGASQFTGELGHHVVFRRSLSASERALLHAWGAGQMS